MRIGKMKKLLASVLVFALGIGIINNGVINANAGETTTPENNRVDNQGLETNKTIRYEDGEYKIRLESYVTGEVRTDTKVVPTDIVLVLDRSGSMAGKQMTDLKNAVYNFIDQTSLENSTIEDENSKHRLSIVSFASNSNINQKLNVVEDNRSVWQYKYAVSRLYASGGTNPDLGLEDAEEVLANSGNRKKVVIMFTDGEPGDYGWDNSIASDTIANAKTLKSSGTTIYTIGLFNGANPDALPSENPNNDNQRFNSFLHAVSSNYPNAELIEKNDWVCNHRGCWWETTYTWSLGDRAPESDYYKGASDSSELDDIFQEIHDDISTPSIELDENTVLKDTLSDYFTFPEGFNRSKVKVYTQNATGKSGEVFTFDGIDVPFDGTVNIDYNSKTVNVSGFDYSENFVAIDENSNQPRGKKLIVEFTVKPIEGFIGGNNVPSNDDSSGIYSNTNELVENFEVPVTDVEINYHYDNTDAAMYITENWTKFQEMIDQGSYSIEPDGKEYNISDPLVNDFVNVTYTFKHNGQDIGKYTVLAGEDTGSWESLNGFDASTFTSDVENFEISVSVEPSQTTTTDTPINAAEIDGNKTSKLFIYKPAVESIDEANPLFIGDTDDLTNNVNDKNDWKCADVNCSIRPTSETPPTLSFVFTPNDGGNNTTKYTPDTAGIVEIEYDVYANGKKITDYTHKTHSLENRITEGCEKEDCKENHFYIEVEGGSIDLTKFISKDDLDKYDFNDGDPIFTFMIRGENGDVYYRSVRFYEEDGSYVSSKIPELTGLSSGTYTITELPSLRFEYVKSEITDNGDSENVNNGIKVTIDKEDPSASVKFTNTIKSNGHETDSDIVVNTFTKDDDGNISFGQDWLNGKTKSDKDSK